MEAKENLASVTLFGWLCVSFFFFLINLCSISHFLLLFLLYKNFIIIIMTILILIYFFDSTMKRAQAFSRLPVPFLRNRPIHSFLVLLQCRNIHPTNCLRLVRERWVMRKRKLTFFSGKSSSLTTKQFFFPGIFQLL